MISDQDRVFSGQFEILSPTAELNSHDLSAERSAHRESDWPVAALVREHEITDLNILDGLNAIYSQNRLSLKKAAENGRQAHFIARPDLPGDHPHHAVVRHTQVLLVDLRGPVCVFLALTVTVEC